MKFGMFLASDGDGTEAELDPFLLNEPSDSQEMNRFTQGARAFAGGIGIHLHAVAQIFDVVGRTPEFTQQPAGVFRVDGDCVRIAEQVAVNISSFGPGGDAHIITMKGNHQGSSPKRAGETKTVCNGAEV